MEILIKNGTLVDPANGINEKRNILVEDGIVKSNDLSDIEAEKMAENVTEDFGLQVIDASGLVVMPGFIDLHVHFRDPGLTAKEDIVTGSMAAAAGGVTSVCPMPNTKPVIDNAELVRYEIEKGREAGFTNVLPIGAVTLSQEGKVLADQKAMKEAGAVAISEDGKSVMDIAVYREAMKQAAANDVLIMAHCEDKNLVAGGVMNAGKKQEELGLPGITNAVEDVIAARDIFLAGETGARLHLCHCSTEASVELVRLAKKLGYAVTAEVCPHHFTLTDDDIPRNDAMWKMNPPLRSKKDVEALIEGLADGTMDVISTDHAPHTAEEKSRGFENSPFGIVGLETSFALGYTYLVKTGKLSLSELVEKMSANPARILGIKKGNLGVSMPADIAIADIDNEYTVNPEEFYSKGKNTPYAGAKLYGKIKYTLLGGKTVYPFR